MPRPWDYTPFRRRVMQAVLCAVLGVSVLLAWLVSHEHRKALTPSQWQNRTFESFNVRVPAGWRASAERGRAFVRTVLDEPQAYMGVARKLVLEQVRIRGNAASLEDFAMQIGDDRVTPEMCQPLDFASQKGMLVHIPRQEIDDDGVRRMIGGRLFAITLLPSRAAIVVELIGPRQFTAADIELLKTVAQSMKEAV